MQGYIEISLVQITAAHCCQAREMLGWSVETLSRESGVSINAIEQYEAGQTELRLITRQALAFRIEAEGLVLIAGWAPMRGANVRGCTPDPSLFDDFELIE